MVVQCRSCLTKTASEYIDMQSSFGFGGLSYLDCFNQISGLQVGSDDLPATICIGCSHDLQVAFDFVQVARQADTILRENRLGDEVRESKMERIEYAEGSDEEECVIEELLEDNNYGGSVLQQEIVEEHMLDDSMYESQNVEEKPELTHSNSPPETLQIKEEPFSRPDFYSGDELDDEYLIEFREEVLDASSLSKRKNYFSTKLAPSGSKWRCVECKRVLRGDVSYEGHMNMHKDVRPYKCIHCQCTFRCKYALERHIELRHPVEMTTTRFGCDLCQKEFGLQMLLEEHQCEELESLQSCTKCMKSFESHFAVEEHQQLVHCAATSSIQCPHCSLASLPRAEIAEHFRAEHPAEYLKHFQIENIKTSWQCEICKRCLRSELALRDHRNTHLNNLRGHMRSVHTQLYERNVGEGSGETVVQCEICKKQLLRRNFDKHLALHDKKEREASEGQVKFLCAYCPQEFNKAKYLTKHEKNTHILKPEEPKYECADCGKKCFQLKNLHAHRDRVHSSERKYACKVCGNVFKGNAQLSAHMRLHEEKIYACSNCDKRYPRKADLIVHLRTHTGELPYVCHLCEKRFPIKVRLTYHLQKHQGVTHPCPYCTAIYDNRNKLKEHIFKHTGMPYRCERCPGVGFARRMRFANHMLRSHKQTLTEDELAAVFAKNTGKTVRFRTAVSVQE